MKKLFWIIVALSLLAACQPTTESTLAPPPPPSPTPTSTPAPEPAPSPGPAEVTAATAAAPRPELAIVYGRSGGLAGIAETWEIYAGGAIVFTRASGVTELQIASQEVEALLAEFEALGLFSAEAQEPPLLSTGADRITYSLKVYREPGKPQTITMVDGMSDLPDSVAPAFKAVDDLIARASE